MAKRVNTRFLVLLTSGIGVLVLLAAGLFLYHRLSSHNPQKFIDRAEQKVAAHDYAGALEDYGRAIGMEKGRADLLVRYGEIQEYLVGTVREALEGSRAAWRQALVTDPTNKPALQHLMDSYLQEMQVRPNPGVYPRLREFAGKLAVVDPSDLRASAYEHIATILQSQAGITTAPALVADAMKALESQVKANPGDSDLLYYFSRGKLRMAQDLSKGADSDKANELIASLHDITDAAVKAEPQDPAISWRAWMIYNGLAELDKPHATALQAQATTAIQTAHAAVKPADPHFQEIETAMASSLFQQKKTAEGAAMLREIHKKNPEDPAARLQLARYLGSQPATRQEAIDLLGDPIKVAGQVGMRASFYREYEAQRLYQLTLLRIDSYSATDDPARRKLLLDQMQDSYKSFCNIATTDSVAALRLQGLIQQLKGQNIEAVATFHRALNTMQRNGQTDTDLLLQAGRLDLSVGQTGSAAKLLSQYASALPNAVGPRLELVSLYISADNLDEAGRLLAELDTLAPDSPDVISRHIQLLLAQKNTDAARPYYVRLPEKTAADRRLKAQTAISLKDSAEAIRLLEPLRAENPADTRLSLALAQVYTQRDQKDKAAAVIDEALKLKPGDGSLLVMQKQLQNATPEELRRLVEQLNAGADPFSREIQAFQLAMGKDQFEDAAAHLATANSLKPDNKIVHQNYFQLYLVQRKFDEAAKEIPTLARLNADEADGLIFRTRLAMAQENPGEAVKYGQELVSRRPDFAESYTLLGAALQESGRFADASQTYAKALEHQSNNFDALKGAAEVAMAMQQPDKSVELIHKGLGLFPNSGAFREMSLNYDLLYSNHPQTVVAERQKMLAASPNQPAAYASLAQASLQVSKADAESDPAASKQMLATARDTLQKAATRWPDDPRFTSALADVMQRAGESAAAEKMLLDFAARPKWAQDPQPWRNLADFYSRVNQHDPYVAALQKAIALGKSSKSVELRQRLAAVQAQDGHTDDALATLKDLNDASVVQQRISIQLRANRVADAEKGIKDALAASPNSSALLNMLTSVYIDTGRFDAARESAKNAVAADSKDDAALYYQSLVEMRRPGGDLNLALKDLRAAKEHSPRNVTFRTALAEVDRRRNQLEDALHELEDVLQIAPGDREARLNLLAAYLGSDPPRWEQYDKLLTDTMSMPQLKADPIWLQRQAAGLSARQQYTAAADRLRAALRLSPDSPGLEFDLLSTLLKAKDYAATIQEANRLLATSKQPWWALYCRGIAHAAADKKSGLADFDAAIASATAEKNMTGVRQVIGAVATQVGPDEALQRVAAQGSAPDWRLFAAELNQQKADYAAVLKFAQGVADDTSITLTSPQRATALRLIAEAYQGQKQLAAAKTAYLNLMQIAPDNVVALNNFAFMLADDLHDPQTAKPYIQRAYQLSQKSEGLNTVADTYGWVFTLAGGNDAKTGLTVLQNLVDNSPDFLDARYHLGMALLRQNDADGARTQFQTALDQLTTIRRTQPAYRPELQALLTGGLDKAKQASGGASAVGP